MLSEIKFSYPSWFLILCLLLGIAYALVMYYRDSRFDESPKWSQWLMPILRTITVTGLATLLLSPLVKTLTETVKQPILVIAQDASQSVVSGMDESEVVKAKGGIDNLTSKLRESYEVKQVVIGDRISEGAVDSFSSNVTNLSSGLEYIDDNYGDQNLGAIILTTDGIYNEGKNPIYTNTNITAPIYVVAQGDTTIRRDISIKNIFSNKIAYLGDKFSIQVDINADNAESTATSLSVKNITEGKNTSLHSENIKINRESFFTTKEIIINASQVGVNKIRVSLSPVSNEVTTANNYKDIYVEVLDARQKILLLANAPHPDLSALKTIITNNKNYEAEVKFIQDGDVRIQDYNMVILHNLPSKDAPIAQIQKVMDDRRVPRLYIVGAQTNTSLLNTYQDVVKINSNGSGIENIEPTLVGAFSSFTIGDEMRRTLRRFPALIAPYGEYTDPLGSNVLLTQRIKDIETGTPLLAFSDKKGYKSGVFVGEGLWKWRLYNFVETQNYDIVEELVNKTVQYISTKADKRKFRASSSKNLYKENEEVIFDAQLYNDNYEMVNGPDVFLSVKNSEGKEYKFTLSRSNNYYALNANLLPVGRYSYRATTNYNGSALEQKGYFTVQDIQLELYDLTARHGMLRSLSNKYGGKVVYPSEVETLIAGLTGENRLKPLVYPNTKTKSVINFKWIFWLLLMLLSGEWFLRRYMGNY